MAEWTNFFNAANNGDRKTARELIAKMYDELKALASRQLAGERHQNTLQTTALVNEAFLKFKDDQYFESEGHFYAAAAQAMRQILIDAGRKRATIKHGGHLKRKELYDVADDFDIERIIELDRAIEALKLEDPLMAQLVEIHYAGKSIEEAGVMLNLPRSTAYKEWQFARAWLKKHISGEPT
jgi:RNA polymerase sigma factor (TIGR02999 family)